MPGYSTYNPALTTPLDRVRFSLGDTTHGEMLLEDSTITAALTAAGVSATGATISNQPVIERRAVLELARGLLTRVAQEPDSVRTADGSQVSYKNRADAWRSLVARLEGEGLDTPDSVPAGMRVLRPTRGTVSRCGEFGNRDCVR